MPAIIYIIICTYEYKTIPQYVSNSLSSPVVVYTIYDVISQILTLTAGLIRIFWNNYFLLYDKFFLIVWYIIAILSLHLFQCFDLRNI